MKNGQQASLFDFDEVEEQSGQPTAHIPGFETMAPETQQALGQMVIAVWDAASSGKLPHQGKKAEAPKTHRPKKGPSQAILRGFRRVIQRPDQLLQRADGLLSFRGATRRISPTRSPSSIS